MIYVTIILLNALDLLTSILAINEWGIAIEMNPFMAPVIESWRIYPLKIGGAALMCFIVYLLKRRGLPRANGAAWWVVGFYTCIVYCNVLVLVNFLGR